MKLDVGPVAPASAVVWMKWVDVVCADLDSAPPSPTSPSTAGFVEAVSCLERWMPRTGGLRGTVRWQPDVDPDELEYLAHAFFKLDTQLSDEVASPAPPEGRAFYLVLVRALLHALETESPSRAAFVDQLRSSWPTAAEAS